jgi:hypothetical protein
MPRFIAAFLFLAVEFIRAFIPPKIVIPTVAERSERSGGTCLVPIRELLVPHCGSPRKPSTQNEQLAQTAAP